MSSTAPQIESCNRSDCKAQHACDEEEGAACSKARTSKIESDMAPQMIEVCCGSATLTAAFLKRGLPALGVDWSGNRHVQKAPVLNINMATKDGLEQIRCLLDGSPELQLVWLGVPCGTASRARDIPGPNLPPPLRSAAEPWGISEGIGQENRKRVEAANQIYRNALQIIAWCRRAQVTPAGVAGRAPAPHWSGVGEHGSRRAGPAHRPRPPPVWSKDQEKVSPGRELL